MDLAVSYGGAELFVDLGLHSTLMGLKRQVAEASRCLNAEEFDLCKVVALPASGTNLTMDTTTDEEDEVADSADILQEDLDVIALCEGDRLEVLLTPPEMVYNPSWSFLQNSPNLNATLDRAKVEASKSSPNCYAAEDRSATPLWLAVRVCAHDLTKVLIERGALVICEGTPFVHLRRYIAVVFEAVRGAAIGGVRKTAILHLLLDAALGQMRREEYTVQLAESLQDFVAQQYSVAMREVMTVLKFHGADINHNNGRALHAAVKARDSDKTTLFLELGADANAQDTHNRTVLMHAAASGVRELCEALITHGADPRCADPSGMTSFHHALAGNKRSVVCHSTADIFRKGIIAPNSEIASNQNVRKDFIISTPFSPTQHYVLNELCTHRDVADLNLIFAPHDDNNNTSSALDKCAAKGLTLLMRAAVCGLVPLVACLLQTHDVDVTTADKHGTTVLHHACSGADADNAVAIVTLLLDHSPMLGACDRHRRTPLHAAAASNLAEVCCLLIEAGADPNAVDRDGHTPLATAIMYGFERTAEKMLALCRNAIDDHGAALLQVATESHSDHMVGLLLEAHADLALQVRTKDLKQCTPKIQSMIKKASNATDVTQTKKWKGRGKNRRAAGGDWCDDFY